MEQIVSGIYVETGNLGSNNSIIVADGDAILIDAPHKPTDAVRWREIVASHGEVRYLIHTDHHIDHTLGNRWLPGMIVSHEVTRQRMAEEYPEWPYIMELLTVVDPESLELMSDFSLRLPEITFSERLWLHVGDIKIELIHLPGHTANSLIAYLPEQGVIFAGDNVCEAGLPAFHDAHIGDWFRAMDYIESLDFETLIPGHGEAASRQTVSNFRGQTSELVGQVEDAIRDGKIREEAAGQIGFEDNIHTGTTSYVGYPEDLILSFQRKSVLSIYDELVGDRAARLRREE